MKKVFLNYLVIAALAGAAAFTSCEKDGGNDDEKNKENGAEVVKLLETSARNVGDYIKYEYDNQNRITKVLGYYDGKVYSTETFTYSGDDLVKTVTVWTYPSEQNSTYDFVKSENGNTITVTEKWNGEEVGSPITITLNSNGLPAKMERSEEDWSRSLNYQYQGNNFTKITDKYTEGELVEEIASEYKYDNNKAPFYHCKTPKWYLIWSIQGTIGVHNNMIEATWEDGKSVLTYDFDADGYPTKMTVKTVYDEDYEDEWERTFTYKVK